MISRNYHHIENHPVLSKLFPRENLIGGTKRDKNLSELISPTVQRSPDPTSEDTNRVDDDPDDEETRPTGRHNGSYHCDRFREKNKCEVCSHMKETSTIFSFHFQRSFAIHGRNIHLLASQMFVQDGPRLRKPAWTGTTPTLVSTNISRMVAQGITELNVVIPT